MAKEIDFPEVQEAQRVPNKLDPKKHTARPIMIKSGCKMKEEMKAIQSGINKNIQGTNSEGKETGIQINDLEQKEEINLQPDQNEKNKISKK